VNSAAICVLWQICGGGLAMKWFQDVFLSLQTAPEKESHANVLFVNNWDFFNRVHRN
jgi:hypothetical protein